MPEDSNLVVAEWPQDIVLEAITLGGVASPKRYMYANAFIAACDRHRCRVRLWQPAYEDTL